MTENVPPMELHCDPMREDRYKNATGIYVRARSIREGWGSFDIAQLDRDSVVVWARSRGPASPWAVNVILLLLRFPQAETIDE